MSNSNYPPGFDQKLLDNPYEGVELSDEQRQVVCVIKVYCGEDEEQVYAQSFSSLADLEASGLRKAEGAIKGYQDKEFDYLLDRVRDESEA